MVKGFTQEYGINYEETFALVAHITHVRTLLSISATKKWILMQINAKNAFLNGELKEVVCMHPPAKIYLSGK